MLGSMMRLRYFFNRCKPEAPIPADDPENWYVDFDTKGLRGERCIDALFSTIDLAEEPTYQLFTGFPGSGKTSELYRLVQRLERDDYFVVYADALESIDIHNEVAYSDVLIALGLAVDRALDTANQRGSAWKWGRRFGTEVQKFFSSDVKLKSFTDTEGSSKFGLMLKENPSFRLALRAAANNHRHQFLAEVRTFFAAADTDARRNGFEGGLVVILDNLEKLTDAEKVQQSARTLFLHVPDALKAPGVHLVYTVPARLVFSKSGARLGTIYDNEPMVLPMVKNRDRKTGDSFEEGRKALRDLLLRRLELEEVFDSNLDAVNSLVDSSGGYTRDLLRLARYALQSAGQLPITQTHVEAAIAKLKKSYIHGYSTADEELLLYIDKYRPSIIREEHKAQLEDVMTSHFAMIYGNAVNWYDLHPLVGELLHKRQTSE